MHIYPDGIFIFAELTNYNITCLRNIHHFIKVTVGFDVAAYDNKTKCEWDCCLERTRLHMWKPTKFSLSLLITRRYSTDEANGG